MKGRNPWLYVSAPETYAGTARIAGGSGVAAAPTYAGTAGKMELAKNICSE